MHHLLLSIIDSTKYGYYFGTTDKNLFLSALFFGYVGVFVMILIDVSTRVPDTTYSPKKFDFNFFIKDNLAKIILDLFLVAICIRFLPQLFNQPISQFYAFLIGVGSDKLCALVKKDRDKLTECVSGSK